MALRSNSVSMLELAIFAVTAFSTGAHRISGPLYLRDVASGHDSSQAHGPTAPTVARPRMVNPRGSSVSVRIVSVYCKPAIIPDPSLKALIPTWVSAPWLRMNVDGQSIVFFGDDIFTSRELRVVHETLPEVHMTGELFDGEFNLGIYSLTAGGLTPSAWHRFEWVFGDESSRVTFEIRFNEFEATEGLNDARFGGAAVYWQPPGANASNQHHRTRSSYSDRSHAATLRTLRILLQIKQSDIEDMAFKFWGKEKPQPRVKRARRRIGGNPPEQDPEPVVTQSRPRATLNNVVVDIPKTPSGGEIVETDSIPGLAVGSVVTTGGRINSSHVDEGAPSLNEICLALAGLAPGVEESQLYCVEKPNLSLYFACSASHMLVCYFKKSQPDMQFCNQAHPFGDYRAQFKLQSNGHFKIPLKAFLQESYIEGTLNPGFKTLKDGQLVHLHRASDSEDPPELLTYLKGEALGPIQKDIHGEWARTGALKPEERRQPPLVPKKVGGAQKPGSSEKEKITDVDASGDREAEIAGVYESENFGDFFFTSGEFDDGDGEFDTFYLGTVS